MPRSIVRAGAHWRAGDVGAPEIRRAPFLPADVSSDGVIEGYASVFGERDLCNDVVERGAFRASLDRRGVGGVKMLWQHDPAEPIGVWTSIVEDSFGLRVKGQLDLGVARAREALALLKSGAIDGLSIGFFTRSAGKDRASGVRLLRDVDLQEISLVTFPAAPRARVTAVRTAPAIAPGSLAARRPDLMSSYLRQRAAAAALRFQLELKRAATEMR